MIITYLQDGESHILVTVYINNRYANLHYRYLGENRGHLEKRECIIHTKHSLHIVYLFLDL